MQDYEPTIVSTYDQEMNMIDPFDGLNRLVNLTIVDIGHHVLKDSMLTDCDAFIFCFDIASQESFYSLSSLFQMKLQMEYATEDDDDEEEMPAAMATLRLGTEVEQKREVDIRPIVLVGCKSDLQKERQIDYHDGERLAESFRAPYLECSASSNNRVEDVYELILIELFKKEKKERDRLQEASEQKKMLMGGI